MATVSLRRRKLPSLEAFLAPVDLTGVPLVGTLASISAEIVSLFIGARFSFQRRNSRSLIRKVEVLAVFFRYLADSGYDSNPGSVSSTAVLCFKELYLLLHHSKFLLRYCARSSKLWLLLQSSSLSCVFHDLSRDYSTLLDVFPVDRLGLSDDVREQFELLHKQSRLFVDDDDNDEKTLRDRLYSFLDGFENRRIPNPEELRYFFVDKLGIRDPKSCSAEIEFLEGEMSNHDRDLEEPTRSVVNGSVDIIRYAMFSLFRIEDESEWRFEYPKKQRKCFIAQEIEETFTTTAQDDFICSISLSLMKDPVIVSTGQSYDRSSIARWIEGGRCTCPKTGQKLVDSCLVPNLALRNMIRDWSEATGVSHETPKESLASLLHLQKRASMEANKATISILIQNLADGSELAQTVAAGEILLLTRTVIETRTLIAEAGAIPHLRRLLKSENAVLQEKSVTSIFNLSVEEKNRSRIMEENDCLESIVSVIDSGLTMKARENAAATVYVLSRVDGGYKRMIPEGCFESLASLLRNGTTRGKKDAANALYSIWLHPDNCSLMVNSGGVSALVGALADEEAVAEKAAAVLAVVANQSFGAESIGREESAVAGLMELMRCGTPRGQEKAIATLLQLCTIGGEVVAEKVVRAPGLAGLTQKLLLTGTERAKRRAVSLSRVL
ncbi:unnamed protein product [Thlaspi arvense]|uniref:RING-type E3 ubiquitin transferase n=1 Tax=Thlaspi arvense TaxID=13288 RepID=A0AAU9SA85_THLAR|nr:unnamed protein product [Thlaspi arvense]